MSQSKDNDLFALLKEKTVNVEKSEDKNIGFITEQDRLLAAKQILLGLGILFGLTLIGYLWKPEPGSVLLEICKTSFPPLATLIIAFYFKEKNNG